MKILYACHQFFPGGYAGTERYTLELAKQVQRMGHQVSVLTYALKENGIEWPTPHNVKRRNYEYEGLPVISLRHTDLVRRGWLSGVSFQVQDSVIFEETDRLLGEHRFDILHCLHPMRVGEVIRAAKRRGLKVVLHLMDYWMLCPRGTLLRVDGMLCKGPNGGDNCAMYCYDAHSAQRLMERYYDAQDVLGTADAILSHSQFLIDVFRKNGVDTSKFIHSPNGMDYSKLGFGQQSRDRAAKITVNFGFVGTVLPHKGVHVLIEAFRKVPLHNIRLKVHGGFFGMHEYFSSLLTLAKGDQRIKFCGEYDYNNVEGILRDIDVVVVPSVWYENAPLVISTAQMFGIPVIATKMGGMAEMVLDGVNGLTFQTGSVEELADKICLIAKNQDVLEKLRRNRIPPPRIEAEAFLLEGLYSRLAKAEVRS